MRKVYIELNDVPAKCAIYDAETGRPIQNIISFTLHSRITDARLIMHAELSDRDRPAYIGFNTYQVVSKPVIKLECYCCSCGRPGLPDWDPACRLHGAHGKRACDLHQFTDEKCTCGCADG